VESFVRTFFESVCCKCASTLHIPASVASGQSLRRQSECSKVVWLCLVRFDLGCISPVVARLLSSSLTKGVPPPFQRNYFNRAFLFKKLLVWPKNGSQSIWERALAICGSTRPADRRRRPPPPLVQRRRRGLRVGAPASGGASRRRSGVGAPPPAPHATSRLAAAASIQASEINMRPPTDLPYTSCGCVITCVRESRPARLLDHFAHFVILTLSRVSSEITVSLQFSCLHQIFYFLPLLLSKNLLSIT